MLFCRTEFFGHSFVFTILQEEIFIDSQNKWQIYKNEVNKTLNKKKIAKELYETQFENGIEKPYDMSS